MKDPWKIHRTWVTNRPHNSVHVVMASHDNGGDERIHYTSLREKTPGFDVFQHVEGSSEGHGYGRTGEMSAEDRVRRLIEGDWVALVKHNKPKPQPKPRTAWERMED